MFQVVVLLEPDAVREVEEFRRLHDPAFHRIAAHLPLVAPFVAQDADLIERFDAFRDAAPFAASFGPAAASGHALQFPVVEGTEQLRALQDSLAAWLRGAAPDAHPPTALRVGVSGSPAELELARRALATRPAPPPFAVREIALLLEDARGLWHPVRTRRLVR